MSLMVLAGHRVLEGITLRAANALRFHLDLHASAIETNGRFNHACDRVRRAKDGPRVAAKRARVDLRVWSDVAAMVW
jgi:hypothetical protein